MRAVLRAQNKRVGIIGGGLGGLAAAITAAGRGHSVTLFEANDWTGGKAAVWEEAGFRFDMGPTILTLPGVLEKIIFEAGHNLREVVDLVQLDPQWRCFFDDGSTLDLRQDAKAMAAAVEQFAPGGGAGFERFMAVSRKLHDVSERFFFWRPIGGISDMFRMGTAFNISTLKDVLQLRMGRTVAATIRSMTPDARVAQMLDHFAQYVGSAPDQSPAVLCGIAHMQTHDGVWYPMGGVGRIPAGLARLAGKLGVEIRTSTAIRRIVVDGREVRGVETESGERLEFDAVISNMDSVRTFDDLVEGKPARQFHRKRSHEPACSGVVLYLGLSKAYDHLLHHNFVFSRDAHEEFEAIYRRGVPAADPTCYVCAPGRTDASVAPAGGEALYVLVHAPYLRPGQDWKTMLPGYRRVILDKLASTAGLKDLQERIVIERTLTPQDIHDRYRVLKGAIYGLASHGRFFGAFKPSNRSNLVKGLYLAGGSAHPGPGMPMVLMSGWIASDAMDRDLSGDKTPPGT